MSSISITAFRGWVTRCHVATGSVHILRSYENQGIFWQELLDSAVRWCKKQALKSVFHPIGDKLASNEFISWGETTKSEQKEGEKRTKQVFLATWWIFCQMSVGLCCLEIHYLLLMANLLAVFSHWQSVNQFDGVRGKSSQMPALIFLPVSLNRVALGNPSSAWHISHQIFSSICPSQMRDSLLPNAVVLTLDLSRQEFVKWHLLIGDYRKPEHVEQPFHQNDCP